MGYNGWYWVFLRVRTLPPEAEMHWCRLSVRIQWCLVSQKCNGWRKKGTTVPPILARLS